MLSFPEQFGVVLGALISTFSTAANIIIIVDLYRIQEWSWMGLLIGFTLIAALFGGVHAAAYGNSPFFKASLALLQLHHAHNAYESLKRGSKTEEYVGARLFQAVLESAPAAVLQLYILLSLEKSGHFFVMSMILAGVAIASTLAFDTAPTDTTIYERPAIFLYCFCEIVATMISMSLFALTEHRLFYIGVSLHFLLIMASSKWWAPGETRRLDLFGMGLFSAVINIFTTVHVGEDSSYVYVCFAKYTRDQPHFLRGGAHLGAFLGLALVQSAARIAYMAVVVSVGFPLYWHRYLGIAVVVSVVIQNIALIVYWKLWSIRLRTSPVFKRARAPSEGATAPTSNNTILRLSKVLIPTHSMMIAPVSPVIGTVNPIILPVLRPQSAADGKDSPSNGVEQSSMAHRVARW